MPHDHAVTSRSVSDDPLEQSSELILELAAAARRETMRRWRQGIGAEDKSFRRGAFDPVTEADRAAELAMRRLIEKRFPEHGIIGEEFSDRAGSSDYSWSIDPLDGTRAFICGLPTWVTLIALLQNGAPVLGLIDAPALGETYVGHGSFGTLASGADERPLAASSCRQLTQARLSTTDPDLFTSAEAAQFAQLRAEALVTRYGLDGYAYARLAAGSIDLVVESGLKPHDYNALIPVVRAAGGRIGDWRGGDRLAGGQVVAAATPELFREAVSILSRASN